MPPTTAAIDSGSTSAQAPLRKRRIHAGTPAPGSATHAAWATVSAKLSPLNHTQGPMVSVGRRGLSG